MTFHNPAERIVPENWLSLVGEYCDIDLAFRALEGWNYHFHTDSLRGRLLSLQLKTKEAWHYFRIAERRSKRFKKSKENNYRRFLLKMFCFENALTERSLPESEGQENHLDATFLAFYDGEVPEIPAARNLQLYCHGIYLLHREDYLNSVNVFTQLLEEIKDLNGDEKAGYYFSAAVANRSLGNLVEADRQMETACLLIPMLQSNFNMGYFACTASALLRVWGREAEAKEWDSFFDRINMPRKTREILQERNRRIFERSMSLQHVFLF